MRHLPSNFLFLSSLALLGLAACGGNVVVDHDGAGGSGASGGHGGHSTSTLSAMGGSTSDVQPVGPGPGSGGSTTVEVGPGPGPGPGSTSTGPTCDCSSFCAIINDCFQVGDQCMQFCNMIPQGTQQCVCDLGEQCNQLMQCFNQGPGGGGPGPGPGPGPVTGTGMGTGGGGGGISFQCAQCVNGSINDECSSQAEDCGANDECQQLIDCDENCDWDPNCTSSCDMQFPSGVAPLQDFLTCSVCNQCTSDCTSSQIFGDFCIHND